MEKNENNLISNEKPNLFQKVRDKIVSLFKKKSIENLKSNSQQGAF
ncbi:MAG TPA: hypothetical protein P5277_02600 [Candidatus Paceibacterota bacterium]|nr:hypothetical protein [Candidatus Paceibacterota bacterium]